MKTDKSQVRTNESHIKSQFKSKVKTQIDWRCPSPVIITAQTDVVLMRPDHLLKYKLWIKKVEDTAVCCSASITLLLVIWVKQPYLRDCHRNKESPFLTRQQQAALQSSRLSCGHEVIDLLYSVNLCTNSPLSSLD